MKYFLVLFLSIFLITNSWSQSITNVNPNSGHQGETLEVIFNCPNSSFNWNGYVYLEENCFNGSKIYADSEQYPNDSTIIATFTFDYSDTTGYYNLVLERPAGHEFVLTNGFQITQNFDEQHILDFEPKIASQGDTIEMIITGQNIDFNQGFNTISLYRGCYSSSSIEAHNFEVINETQIKAKFVFSYLTGGTGDYKLIVENSIYGRLSDLTMFRIEVGPNIPEIISISPNQGNIGDYVTIRVLGHNTQFTNAVKTFIKFGSDCTIWNNDSISIINDTVMDAYFHLYGHHCYNTSDFFIEFTDGYLSLTNVFTVFGELGIFSTEYTINENLEDGKIIGQIETNISQDDWNYKINDWTEDLGFNVHPTEGYYYVTNQEALDYELISQIDFHIINLGYYDVAKHTIYLNNLNDNIPQISNTILYTYENSNNNSLVGILNVLDADGDLNEHNFVVIEESNPGVFKVNSLTGVITVSDSTELDFHLYPEMQLTVQVSDGYYQSVETIYIQILDNVDVNENIEQLISIFPNPNQGEFIIENQTDSELHISLFNLYGYLIMEKTMNKNIRIDDLYNQPSGVYLLKVEIGDKSYFKKIIKS